MRKFLLVVCLVFLVGCASNPSSSPNTFSAQTPDKWYQVDTPNFYILTKDGPFCQYILVQQRPIDRPFANTTKILASGMSPKDVAGIFLEEVANDEEVRNFRLIENRPGRVNSHEAFKLVFTYDDKDNRQFKTLMYGFLNGNWFYTLRYNADQSLYCNQDIEEFQNFVTSFRAGEA
jgi:hypothetical protein